MMEKFDVTGSYLPVAANAVAIPVITVDSKTIENSGNNTSVLEILRKTVPQFSGNGNLGSSNANVSSGSTNGGSMLALRNTTTLVLINGRRVAYSPVSSSGGYQFVDVNMIPVAAIERIEVLADGASAIYGSDAVAGVVNIILKSDFQGFEIGARYGYATGQGHQAVRSGYIVGGVSNGKTSITISAEWTKEDPIMAYERPYSAVTYGTPTFAGSVNIGGSFYYLNPTTNTPTVAPGGTSTAGLISAGTYSGPRTQGAQMELFNLSRYVTQTIQNERQSFATSFEHHVSDQLRFFGDLLYVSTQTASQINGQPINTTQAMLDIYYTLTGGTAGSDNGKVPAGQFGNPFNTAVTGRNRLVNNPRQYLDDTTSIRGVFGAGGAIGGSDWTWEAATDYNRANQQYKNPGVINQPNLSAAVLAGDFNFFSRTPITAAHLAADQIVGTATGGFISQMTNYDVKVRGKLFDLPAGSLDVAAGAEIRKENLSATADPLSQINPVTGALGWSGATTLYPFDSNRKVTSLFAEVRIPVAKDAPGAHLLELSGAVRRESYSDTTDPTVPKVTIRYLPVNDEFAIRGTYSKSFTAPALFNLFGPSSIGYTDPFTLNTFGGGTVADLQTNSMSGSNPDLKPSNSKNYTLGVVYSPKALKGFSVSLDYWNIKQTDLVSSIGTTTILQDVETLGTASTYLNKVHFYSFTGAHPTAKGQISSYAPDDIYVIDSLVNIAGVKLSGFDAKLAYTYTADSVGRFDFSSNIGIYSKYEVTSLPGTAPEDDTGLASFANGTLPRWSSYSTVEYTRGACVGFLGWRHIPSVKNIVTDEALAAFDSFDVSASYVFGSGVKFLSGSKITLGVTNVLNKFGPLAPDIFTDSGVDTETYGAMGRFVYVDYKIKF